MLVHALLFGAYDFPVQNTSSRLDNGPHILPCGPFYIRIHHCSVREETYLM